MSANSLSDLPFDFTRHARNRLRRTELTQTQLTDLARAATRERRDGNRVNVWVAWNGWLRIVLVEEVDAIIVVSVIWPAREPRD